MTSESLLVVLLVGSIFLIVVVAFVIAARRLLRSRYSPLVYVKDLLYSEVSLQITSPLSPADVKTRLQGAVSRFGIPFVMRTRLVGVVRGEELKIRLHKPFVSNSFAPVMTGVIRQADGQTLISGAFGMPVLVRWFMTFWFGFLGFWSVLGIPAGLLMLILGRIEGALFVLAPLLMYGGGVLLIKTGAAISGSDREQIESRIAEAIGGTVR